MAAKVSYSNTSGFHRIQLVEKTEGVYAFIFEKIDSPFPEYDYLFDDWTMARTICLEDYGVPLGSWVDDPQER